MRNNLHQNCIFKISHLKFMRINCIQISPGSKFLCSVLVAPVKNELNETILFILNLEDITDAPVKNDSYRNSLKNS